MAHLEWYYDEETLNKIIVNKPVSKMRDETFMTANLIGVVASTRLAPHHANNVDDPRSDSSVDVTRGSVDAFVNVNADSEAAAASISKQLGLLAPYHRQGEIKRPKKKKNSKKKKKL